MENPLYDALIIGGGPGGSSAASYLAKAGRRVLVLEKERFPRFHIGESLLPYNLPIFEELGLLPELQKAGFPKKFGAQFHIGNGTKSVQFVFRNGFFTRVPESIQVERAAFDHLLLRNAIRLGAESLEGWTVQRFESEHDSIAVTAAGPDGAKRTFKGRFLVDASGRANLTGNQEGIRIPHPRLKKIAVFGHFRGVKLDPGEKGGDTVIVRLANKWFWIIPLPAPKVSVGCVMDHAELRNSGKSPPDFFFELCASSTVLRERMEGAELIGSIQTTSDFSYRNKRFAGHRLLRVGDAAGFMDPIFSAGVFLAMRSGKAAALAISSAIRSGNDGAPLFRRYETRIRDSMAVYWEMVEQFYTTPFMEVFLEPRERMKIASAVTAVLAGELDAGWQLRWRMRLFFSVVRLQRFLRLLPRIDFAEPASAGIRRP